jgi:ankyrin repeat protein
VVGFAAVFAGTLLVLVLAAAIAVVIALNLSSDLGAPVEDCDTTDVALLRAAYAGDVASVDRLLSDAGGAGVDEVDDDQRTALYCAARGGSPAVVERLLAAGADPDRANAAGDTPLLWAAQQGDLPTAELLLDHGADVDHATDAGHTPLLRAVYGGHEDLVARLLAAGADPDVPAGIDSVEAELLLSGVLAGEPLTADRDPWSQTPVGGTANLPPVTGGPEDGVTALHVATALGRDDLAATLIAAGATVDARALGGYTPLHVAALVGAPDSAFVLLLAGADPTPAAGDRPVPSPEALAGQMGHADVAGVIAASAAS